MLSSPATRAASAEEIRGFNAETGRRLRETRTEKSQLGQGARMQLCS